MRLFVLLTDAFGGHGGIAKFNRDLLGALCANSNVEKVVALPRLIPGPVGTLPAKLEHVVSAARGKLRFMLAVFRTALANRDSDLILCAHINLLPAAFLARRLMRARRAFPLRHDWGEGQGEVSCSSQSSAFNHSRSADSSSQHSTHKAQPPIMLFIHGIDAWQPTRSTLTDRMAGEADAVVAVSNFTLKRFQSWATGNRGPQTSGPRGTRPSEFILPNSIDLERFTPGPRPAVLLDRYGLRNRTVLLTVARLSAQERYKGIDEVLESLPELGKEIPNLAYLIVGDGSDRARLLEKTKSLGLRVTERSTSAPSPPRSGIPSPRWGEGGRRPDEVPPGEVSNPSLGSRLSTPDSQLPRVIFAGHIPESEKVDHYRLADAFVMPGWGEGFGIVYLEALACGIPVVVSTADASAEVVAGCDEAFVADPKQPETINAAIRAALKRSSGLRSPFVEKYSYANYCRQCNAIVQSLVNVPWPLSGCPKSVV